MTPPVVLVHGFAGSGARTWAEAGWLDLLADEGRDARAVDLLGHGDAPAPHDPEAYGDLAGHLAGLLPDEPVDAIGFSLGAQTLLHLAVAQPDRFDRLVLAGIGDDLFDPPDAAPVAALLESADPAALPDQPFVRHLVELASAPGTDRLALAACLRRPRRPLDEAALAGLDRPVLLVRGDREHVPPPDRLLATLPDARLVTLRGVDHGRTPSDFGFLDAALDFLRR